MDFLASHTFTAVTAYSVLTVTGQAIAIVLLALLFHHSSASTWVGRNALWMMLIVALLATFGSLFFSEIAGWTPCKDCWLQRIFMYPQVVLLGMAIWKRDRGIAPYILALSSIGLLIAALHYGKQVDAAMHPIDTSVPCDATGVSCAKTNIHFTFGYITLPMMALTAFALNALGSLFVMRRSKA